MGMALVSRIYFPCLPQVSFLLFFVFQPDRIVPELCDHVVYADMMVFQLT
jgi:hypothetical protein